MTQQKNIKQKSQPPSQDFTLERGLPANIDAEKTILGAILLDKTAIIEAAERLEPDDFSLDSHRRIFQRMKDLDDARRAIDIVTLAEELNRYKEVESVGGVAYMASLTEGLPRRPEIQDYIRIVKDKCLLRRLMAICSASIARAADQNETALEILTDSENALLELSDNGLASTLQTPEQFLSISFPTPESMIDKTARSQGIDTGFSKIDEMTCGFQRKELIIIAARPSMGKTAWAINMALHIVLNCEGRVAINSLEMSTESLMRRAICSRARIPFQQHRSGAMAGKPGYVADFAEAYHEIRRSQLRIDDKPKTAPQIVHQARALKKKFDMDMLVVDHLTLLQHDETIARNMTPARMVGQDCWILKELAKELNIPIVALCQLSRDVTKRSDKRPILSDLRESGEIEQTADLVAFLHRESYYEPKDESLKDKAEFIIGKQRNGPVGTVDLIWQGEFLRYSDPVTAADLQVQEYINW